MNFKFLSFLFFSSSQNPITIVPGFGGSVIYNNENNVVWPPKVIDLIQYPQYFYNIGCHYNDNNFQLNTDTKVGKIGDLEAIKIVNKWMAPIVNHNYYDDLIVDLKKTYCEDCLYGIPYDFRIIGNKSYRKNLYSELKDFFEKTKEKHGEKVIIVTHSLGGLIIHDFLSKQSKKWNTEFIKKVVFVNCPWAGTTNALKLILDEKILIKSLQRYLHVPYIKYFSCLLLLLPNPYFLADKLIYYNDLNEKVQVQNISTYWENDMVVSKLDEHFHDVLKALESKPNVEYNIIVGSNHRTPTRLYQDGETIVIENGQGDGVIEEESLWAFQKWNQESIKVWKIENEEHTKILKSNEFFSILKKLLR